MLPAGPPEDAWRTLATAHPTRCDAKTSTRCINEFNHRVTRLGLTMESGFIKSMSETGERDEAPARDGGPSIPRHTRRLSDKILVAFHHACDTSDLDVAEQLLSILEVMLNRRSPNPDSNRRRSIESLVAAYERLWHLRHPDTEI